MRQKHTSYTISKNPSKYSKYFSRILAPKITSFPTSVFVQNMNFHTKAQCLKITEKVANNIASKASYVYILRGQ